MDHGDAEGERFARAGLRNADKILSFDRRRDGAFLDGRGNVEMERAQNTQYVGRDAEIIKS